MSKEHSRPEDSASEPIDPYLEPVPDNYYSRKRRVRAWAERDRFKGDTSVEIPGVLPFIRHVAASIGYGYGYGNTGGRGSFRSDEWGRDLANSGTYFRRERQGPGKPVDNLLSAACDELSRPARMLYPPVLRPRPVSFGIPGTRGSAEREWLKDGQRDQVPDGFHIEVRTGEARGRPRKYHPYKPATDSERARAYRARKKASRKCVFSEETMQPAITEAEPKLTRFALEYLREHVDKELERYSDTEKREGNVIELPMVKAK